MNISNIYYTSIKQILDKLVPNQLKAIFWGGPPWIAKYKVWWIHSADSDYNPQW